MLRSMGISLFTLILAVSLAGSVGFGCPLGDFSGNCEVNAQDLLMFAEHWLDKNCSDANCGDLDGVTGVNGFDFAKFAGSWLMVGENGSLQVTISPEQAIEAWAQWRVDGGPWRDSGDERSGLSVGPHTVEFKVIFGWTEPNSITVEIEDGITESRSGTYIQQKGSLCVNISPEEVALNPEAKWRVDGDTWQDSGETVSNLSVGTHIVEFSAVENWTKASNRTVQINNELTTTINGVHKQPLVISEFMAINNSEEPLDPCEILDDFGESSDWIEIYNPMSTNINLDGWYLTDDYNEPTKWQFPAGVSLKSGEFLIVFASERNRRDPAKPLHTDFKLTGNGEYLALVSKDGVTITHEYFPEYPKQLGGISYGLKQFTTALVPIGATVSYHVPTIADKDADWTAIDFDDFDWKTGETGPEFGFGSSDLRDQMQNVNASLWTRMEFDLEQGEMEIYDTLILRVKYEDGFAAYLNGQKVAGRNAPASPVWDSCADSNRPIEDASVFEEINLLAFLNVLQTGKNVLAIQGLNDDKSDDEFLILPDLIASQNMDSPQYFTTATPGSLNSGGTKGLVEDVEFSRTRGFYDNAILVRLTTDTPGATIRCTVNGTRPSASSGTLYRTPRMISKTSTLRAVAVKPGHLDSRVQTHTYIFVDDVKNQSRNGEPPGSGWPYYSETGQVLDYGMDPDIVDNPQYSNLIDDALLSIPALSFVMRLDDLFNPNDDPSIGGIYVHAREDGRNWERPVSVELLNPDGSEGFQIDAGLRIRGGFSRKPQNPKHAFRLFFRQEYGEAKLKYPLFGDEGVKEFDNVDLRTSQNYAWALQGSSKNTMVREVFSRDIQGAMDSPYTRSRYYHLYINGHYWGLFMTQERSEASFAESYMGGAKEDYDVIKTTSRYMLPTDGNRDAYRRLYDATKAGFSSNTAYYKVQGMNPDGTVNPSYEKLLDVDNLIDYMIIDYYTADRDGAGSLYGNKPNNTYCIYNRVNPDGWKWFQHDSEHSLGTGVSNDNLVSPLTTSRSNGYKFSQFDYFAAQWLHERLTANADYRQRFADHVQKHLFNGGLLTPEVATAYIDYRAAQIDLAIIAESARWGDSKHYPPYTRADWLKAIDDPSNNKSVKRWISKRKNTLLSQFRGQNWFTYVDAPTLSQYGGWDLNGFTVTMSPPDDTIYYTLDGSDPRLPGGAVNTPGAQEYSGGNINLTQTTHLKARVLDGGTWSALSEAIFAVGPVTDNLRITEMMYHPPDTNDPEDPNKEYIELKNISETTDLNVNLVSFANGIDFTFPNEVLGAGDYVIVAKDPAVFAASYPDVLTDVNILGPYYGRLDNGGERIRLQDANGRTIQDFKYKDSWRSITDGDGFSLTIIDPTSSDPNSWEEKDSWRASAYPGGSPGADDSGDTHNPGSIVINEVMAHSRDEEPDWIELYNTTGSSIDISGWFLSDSDSNLMKYEIANSTVIDPYQYELFFEDEHFNNPSDPGCLIPFALSENGEIVCLTAAEGDVLKGFRQREDFGASERGVSFGRYHKGSTGNYNFVAMDSNTPGWKNDYPKVGPIVITEIMYNPQSGNQNQEYIELLNITDEPHTLYDPTAGKSWRFIDGIDFKFPAPPNDVTVIPGGEFLLVVKDPVTFESTYGIMPENVQVLGPYSGKLSNGGEKLEFNKPGDVDADGERQYIRVDRVSYSDGSHPQDCPGGVDYWPTEADSNGASLSRIDPNLYGNDPNNWEPADPPTPGR